MRLFQDGTLLATLTASENGTWSYTPTLPDGTYRFTVTATDAAGNTSPASSVVVTFDTTAPAAPTLVSSQGTLSGSAEANSTVRVFDGSTLLVTLTASASGTWSHTPTLPDGNYRFTATATDGLHAGDCSR